MPAQRYRHAKKCLYRTMPPTRDILWVSAACHWPRGRGSAGPALRIGWERPGTSTVSLWNLPLRCHNAMVAAPGRPHPAPISPLASCLFFRVCGYSTVSSRGPVGGTQSRRERGDRQARLLSQRHTCQGCHRWGLFGSAAARKIKQTTC